MAKQTTRNRTSTIALVVGCFFSVVLVVCFAVGGPLYARERPKEVAYAKALCRVRMSSYNVIESCKLDDSRRSGKCNVPVWHVEFSPNGTRKATIQGSGERLYSAAAAKANEYKIGSSYPCWYNTKKPSVVTWYRPTTFYSIILLICGAISTLLAIVSFFAAYRLNKRAEL